MYYLILLENCQHVKYRNDLLQWVLIRNSFLVLRVALAWNVRKCQVSINFTPVRFPIPRIHSHCELLLTQRLLQIWCARLSRAQDSHHLSSIDTRLFAYQRRARLMFWGLINIRWQRGGIKGGKINNTSLYLGNETSTNIEGRKRGRAFFTSHSLAAPLKGSFQEKRLWSQRSHSSPEISRLCDLSIYLHPLQIRNNQHTRGLAG